MKCGQLALLSFPFTDQSGAKVRPVLVVSANEFNAGEDVVVVPLSSSRRGSQHDIEVGEGAQFFATTQLRQTSFIRWTKPFVVSKAQMRRLLGELPSDELQNVLKNIRLLFTLPARER